MRGDLLVPTEHGLHCAPGGFHVDPWRPVERAIVTHAHSDHARVGCGAYLCSREGEGVLRRRLGADAVIEALDWGETREVGGVRVSLHPAGHILGSAQVRLEHGGDVWVAAGDYKTTPDPTCSPFEPVRCRVFITESTFGLPVYRWEPAETVFDAIHRWWRANREEGRTSILMAYSLGKAQRLLAGIDAGEGPILLHGAAVALSEEYARAGRTLAPWAHADAEASAAGKGRALVIAPPAVAGSPWLRRFGDAALAFASGWMALRGTRRRRAVERGFAISDHADWPGLLAAIDATGAERVGVTHGYTAPLVRYLRERGRDAWEVPTRFVGEAPEEAAPGDGTAED
ncbi:MAG: ligase-associated DNA damage response exonuclease [Candidatus Sumerlaeia bacterium]|nr:ligase-associated DNA damage response exonuclease [Candidatus Sumerlaeia bacterium]